MQFRLDDDQQAILAAVDTILTRHAGPERARALGGDAPSYDEALNQALHQAGFLDLARDPDAGPLEAALVVERVARSIGVAAVGAEALVAPALLDSPVPGPLALTVEGHHGPIRFLPDARTLLVAGPEEARVVELEPGMVEPVSSRYGFPMGRLVDDAPAGAGLGAGTSARMLAWWRVALAVEMAGLLQAALDFTVAHVSQRYQFGRPIGSFQVIHHGLAEAAVGVQGSRWLALEAAALGAQAEAAAVAATAASTAARTVFPMLHQFTGAIGFTTEYDLHLWTMRLPALWLEAEWMGHPDAAVASARWDPEAA